MSTRFVNMVLRRRDLYLEAISSPLVKEIKLAMRSSSFLARSLFENLDKAMVQKIEQGRKQDLIMKAVQAPSKSAPAVGPPAKKARTQRKRSKRRLKFTTPKGKGHSQSKAKKADSGVGKRQAKTSKPMAPTGPRPASPWGYSTAKKFVGWQLAA